MPSPESIKRLQESQVDRLTTAEAYAISVISRTPPVDRKRVFMEFSQEVFGNDRLSAARVGERFGFTIPG
jgi:hypothetical protein